MPPRTPQNKQEEVPLELEESELLVRQPIRGISKKNVSDHEQNIWNVTEVNAYLSDLIRQGYRVQNSFNFGQDTNAYWVMYILVKDG